MQRWRHSVYSWVSKLILSVSIYHAKARPKLEKDSSKRKRKGTSVTNSGAANENFGGGVREAVLGPASGVVKGKNGNKVL